MNIKQKIQTLREYITNAQYIVFFGGAGVSTESGIPDFRSAGGVFAEKKYDAPPEVMLSRTYFFKHPDKFYEFYKDKMLHPDAKPNDAHKALAYLERIGKLKAVITQNVDNLHQCAGSRTVIELHGSVSRNFCRKCKKSFDLSYIIDSEGTPKCDNIECGGIIKPDVVLYEEPLNEKLAISAISHISAADMLIVGGTSLAVYPAAHYISYFGRNQKATDSRSVIINKSTTYHDDSFDLAIHEDSIGNILRQVVKLL